MSQRRLACIRITTLAYLLPLLTAFAWGQNLGQFTDAVGQAYKPGTNELLYIERYSTPATNKIQVLYEDAQGNALAQKILDFSAHAHAPDMANEDFRLGTQLQVKSSAAGVDIERSGGDKKAFKVTVARAENLVIDAGFDTFVRENWESLVAGKRLSLGFLVPERKTTVALRIWQHDCPAIQEAKVSESLEARRCFRLKAVNWLVAMAMKTIDLEYIEESRRLLRFTGLGQLPDGRGKGQRIDLHYRY